MSERKELIEQTYDLGRRLAQEQLRRIRAEADRDALLAIVRALPHEHLPASARQALSAHRWELYGEGQS